MATIKEDIKQNFREAIEDRTGIVGQVLRDRRKAQEHEKQVTTQLSKIGLKTTRLKNDNRAYKKIEVSTTQVSENLQLINKWAGAQVTTHAETVLSMEETKQTQQAQAEQLAQVSLPNTKEFDDTFGSILDLFDKFGKKIKLRFPKGLGKAASRAGRVAGRAGKAAGRSIFNIARQVIKSPITKVGAVAAVGIGAATYSKGLNTNKEEELAKTRNLPPAITKQNVHEGQGGTQPTYENYGNEGRRTKQEQAPTVAQQIQAPGEAGRGVVAQAIAAVAAPLPPAPPPVPPPTPIAAPQPAATVYTSPKAVSEEKMDTSAFAAFEKAVRAGADKAKPIIPEPQQVSSTPSPSSVPSLSSVTKLENTGVILAGLKPDFEKRVAMMAADFKEQTGEKLQINSGFRSPEKQKQLYDEWIAGGKKGKVVAAPGTSPHEKGLAVDIQASSAPKGTGSFKGFLNQLAGAVDAPTGWLEKFGIVRPVTSKKVGADKKEDWHVQFAGAAPVGDLGAVSSRGGAVDPSTGQSVPVPVDPNTGKQLLDTTKTVDQLKKEQSQRGTDTIVMTNTTNVIVPNKKKKPQGQTAAALS